MSIGRYNITSSTCCGINGLTQHITVLDTRPEEDLVLEFDYIGTSTKWLIGSVIKIEPVQHETDLTQMSFYELGILLDYYPKHIIEEVLSRFSTEMYTGTDVIIVREKYSTDFNPWIND